MGKATLCFVTEHKQKHTNKNTQTKHTNKYVESELTDDHVDPDELPVWCSYIHQYFDGYTRLWNNAETSVIKVKLCEEPCWCCFNKSMPHHLIHVEGYSVWYRDTRTARCRLLNVFVTSKTMNIACANAITTGCQQTHPSQDATAAWRRATMTST